MFRDPWGDIDWPRIVLIGMIVVTVAFLALVVWYAVTHPTPSMYVRGYVPVESGERVVCVYDKKWIQTGKTGYYQHNLYCSEE